MCVSVCVHACGERTLQLHESQVYMCVCGKEKKRKRENVCACVGVCVCMCGQMGSPPAHTSICPHRTKSFLEY